jgi:DNA repair photolyase
MNVYYGEFLVTPIPLELSLERCQNGCKYCFSNLNDYKLKQSMTSILNRLTMKNSGLECKLLKDGYPVLMSNRTDPFSSNNYKNTIKICEILTELGKQIAFQTKGGKGIDEVLSFIPPSGFDITICFDDDNLRKQFEPNTISIDERFELIAKLKDHGHVVYVGMCPAVREWCKDYEKHIDRIKASGADGLWVEKVHFNRDQIANWRSMPDYLKVAAAKNQYYRFIDDCLDYAESIGLPNYIWENTRHSTFWNPYREIYKKTFPVKQDLVNACVESEIDLMPIDFELFYDLLQSKAQFPKGEYNLVSYVASTSIQVVREMRLGTMTYKQLLSLIFKDHRIKTNPIYLKCFANIVDGNALLVDGRGLPYLSFDREFFDRTIVDISEIKGGE